MVWKTKTLTATMSPMFIASIVSCIVVFFFYGWSHLFCKYYEKCIVPCILKENSEIYGKQILFTVQIMLSLLLRLWLTSSIENSSCYKIAKKYLQKNIYWKEDLKIVLFKKNKILSISNDYAIFFKLFLSCFIPF